MLKKRIIPCLDVKDGRVVKGVNFVNLTDVGAPVDSARAYYEAGCDELVFLDITATSDNRETTVDMVRRVADQVFIPFTVGGGIRSLNVALRQELDLYACVRPVRYFDGVASPLKEPEKTNITIFRENTEDIYAGIEWEAGTADVKRVIEFLQTEMNVNKIRFPESSSIGIKPISIEGSKRLIRSAIDYALKNNLKKVTLVHKGNIQKFTEGGFRKWGYEVAEEEYKEEMLAGRLEVNDISLIIFYNRFFESRKI